MKLKTEDIKSRNLLSQVKIFIADQHPVVRQGFISLINKEKDMTVIAETENPKDIFSIIKSMNPDMGIINISIGGDFGPELIKNIKAIFPKLPVLAISTHNEALLAERIIKAGAKGYIMKNEKPENLISAIRKVSKQQIYTSDKVTAKFMDRITHRDNGSPIENLTDRELEIYILIGEGHGVKQIAEKLYLSTKTIETYKAKLKEKLNIGNASELRRHAVLWLNSNNK
ncbi:MAG TPA: DNA-binding response regulator [Phycisphaerales bacterium]|nr:DNA-binding response regulator [Phycisphaerales bacterium]